MTPLLFVPATLGLLVFLGMAPKQAHANSCKSSGNLNYIGRTTDNGRSVWLSTTKAGNFFLEAAQGNTLVDSFSRDRSGARLSLSPFVSNGSGGVHRLFEQGAAANGGDCLVDTQNQKNGIQFPERPPGLIRPPVGITPPIAVLPPNVRPPLGGVTPGLPTRPVPPIGVPPPSGVTPGAPSRPTPPIGTRPPTGVTPGLPTNPVPPIATLPPTGVTPGLPGAPSAPTTPLPPTGVTPGGPGQPQAPTETRPPEGALSDKTAKAAPCDATAITGKYGAAPCDPSVVAYDTGGYPVPITPGRDLSPPSPWNLWTDFSINRTNDDRSRAKTEIRGTFFGIGIDRYVAENTVVGIQIEFEQSDRDSFDGLMSVDSTTVSVGPYFSILLNENWSASGLFTLGDISRDVDIANLSGSFDTTQARASANATGQYFLGAVEVRPSATLDYTYTDASDGDLVGTVASIPVRVEAEVASGWIGAFSPTVEFSRVYSVGDGLLVPFTELGASYSFGETGNAFSASQGSEFEEWSGSVAAGVRFSARNGFFVEASFAYNSLFQQDLDSVEVGLFAAWNF